MVLKSDKSGIPYCNLAIIGSSHISQSILKIFLNSKQNETEDDFYQVLPLDLPQNDVKPYERALFAVGKTDTGQPLMKCHIFTTPNISTYQPQQMEEIHGIIIIIDADLLHWQDIVIQFKELRRLFGQKLSEHTMPYYIFLNNLGLPDFRQITIDDDLPTALEESKTQDLLAEAKHYAMEIQEEEINAYLTRHPSTAVEEISPPYEIEGIIAAIETMIDEIAACFMIYQKDETGTKVAQTFGQPLVDMFKTQAEEKQEVEISDNPLYNDLQRDYGDIFPMKVTKTSRTQEEVVRQPLDIEKLLRKTSRLGKDTFVTNSQPIPQSGVVPLAEKNETSASVPVDNENDISTQNLLNSNAQVSPPPTMVSPFEIKTSADLLSDYRTSPAFSKEEIPKIVKDEVEKLLNGEITQNITNKVQREVVTEIKGHFYTDNRSKIIEDLKALMINELLPILQKEVIEKIKNDIILKERQTMQKEIQESSKEQIHGEMQLFETKIEQQLNSNQFREQIARRVSVEMETALQKTTANIKHELQLELSTRVKSDFYAELKQELLDELRVLVTTDVRTELRQEILAEINKSVSDKLLSDLKPVIDEKLSKTKQAIVSEVKADVEPSLKGGILEEFKNINSALFSEDLRLEVMGLIKNEVTEHLKSDQTSLSNVIQANGDITAQLDNLRNELKGRLSTMEDSILSVLINRLEKIQQQLTDLTMNIKGK